MNPNVHEFLELVDCQPEDVLNIPAQRVHQPPHSTPGGVDAVNETRRLSLGDKPVYFGKHAGKKLKDVPRDYLEWALGQKPNNKSFRKFQRDAQEFLGGDGSRRRVPKGLCQHCLSKGSRLRAELSDPLTKEFLSIVQCA